MTPPTTSRGIRLPDDLWDKLQKEYPNNNYSDQIFNALREKYNYVDALEPMYQRTLHTYVAYTKVEKKIDALLCGANKKEQQKGRIYNPNQRLLNIKKSKNGHNIYSKDMTINHLIKRIEKVNKI